MIHCSAMPSSLDRIHRINRAFCLSEFAGFGFEIRRIQLILSSSETALNRRTLLRLPVVLRDPEPVQLARRADERNFWFHQDAALDDQASAAGAGSGVLGRRHAGTAGAIAARLQRDAQRDAITNGAAARLHSKAYPPPRIQK